MNMIYIDLDIYTVIDGIINKLIINNSSIECKLNKTIEKCIDNLTKTYLNNANYKQIKTYSYEDNNNLIVKIKYISITNINNIKNLEHYKLLPVKIEDTDILDEFNKISILKNIYPYGFTLPEIQKLFEIVLNKKIDRRNFRKRLIKLDIVEELNKSLNDKKGRPANIYKFKDNISIINLF